MIAVGDLLLQRTIILGLLVIAPLLAANTAGPRVTAAYGAVALVLGGLLGIHDDAYSPGDPRIAQLVRLALIVTMSVVAVMLARDRIRREQRLLQMIKVAEAAQRAILLPVPEQLGPARVAVHYESAAQDALIGGDLYGVVLTSYGLRVLIGDVRGKGLDAVRMSAQVLAAFRERANDHSDPADLLDHLDRTVERCLESPEDFVTAVIVQIAEDGRLVAANAGHPPPLVLAAGRVRPLHQPAARPPLGLGGASRTVALTVAAGDRVLLYTDGLTEARDPGHRRFFPLESVMGALADDKPLPEALATLRDGVLSWSGGSLHDDIALVMIEYQPEAGTGHLGWPLHESADGGVRLTVTGSGGLAGWA